MIEAALFALLQVTVAPPQERRSDEALRSEALTVRHPRPPRRRITSTEIVCGDDVLRISGYGGAIPDDWPTVTLNGHRLAGAERMEYDLRGAPGGVFRISGSCPQGGRQIDVNIVYGQRLENDGLFFQGAHGLVDNGRMRSYSPLSDVNPQTFWYF